MSLFAQALANGILLGGIFGISAVGFSLIFGVMDILNITHGAVVILGAFGAFFAWESFGIDPFVAIVPIMAAAFVGGYVFQRVIIQRILDEEVLVTLLVTFGFALMIRNLLEIFLTATPRSVNPPYATESIPLGPFGALPVVRIIGLAIAIVLFAGLVYVINRTQLGRAIRATAEDRTVARLVGIDTEHVFGITFGIASALSAASGVLIGTTTSFVPADEATWTLYAFVVVVLGGFGRPLGALVGGLILGLAWSYTTIYLGSVFAALVSFGLLVVMLVVRPQGLLGGWESGH